jgi:hypothetical protein
MAIGRLVDEEAALEQPQQARAAAKVAVDKNIRHNDDSNSFISPT